MTISTISDSIKLERRAKKNQTVTGIIERDQRCFEIRLLKKELEARSSIQEHALFSSSRLV